MSVHNVIMLHSTISVVAELIIFFLCFKLVNIIQLSFVCNELFLSHFFHLTSHPLHSLWNWSIDCLIHSFFHSFSNLLINSFLLIFGFFVHPLLTLICNSYFSLFEHSLFLYLALPSTIHSFIFVPSFVPSFLHSSIHSITITICQLYLSG